MTIQIGVVLDTAPMAGSQLKYSDPSFLRYVQIVLTTDLAMIGDL